MAKRLTREQQAAIQQQRDVIKQQIAEGNEDARAVVDMIEFQARSLDKAAHHAADFYLRALLRLRLTPNQVLSLYHNSGSADPRTKLRNMLAIICVWVDTEIYQERAPKQINRNQILRFIEDRSTLDPTSIRKYCRRQFG